jgi:hypothetical protein
MIRQIAPVPASVQAREITRPSHRQWVTEREETFSSLEKSYSAWLNWVGQNEELFQEHVYNAAAPADYDFLQHHTRMCELMAEGGNLMMKFLNFRHRGMSVQAVDNYVSLIDQKVTTLRETFFKWHGDLKAQTDLPESLKQAAREIEAGQIEDWEDL